MLTIFRVYSSFDSTNCLTEKFLESWKTANMDELPRSNSFSVSGCANYCTKHALLCCRLSGKTTDCMVHGFR